MKLFIFLDDRESLIHDQWYYGLISFTFLLKQSVTIVNSSVMKLLQQQLKNNDTFWLSNGLKKRVIFNDPYFNIGLFFIHFHYLEQSCVLLFRRCCSYIENGR